MLVNIEGQLKKQGGIFNYGETKTSDMGAL